MRTVSSPSATSTSAGALPSPSSGGPRSPPGSTPPNEPSPTPDELEHLVEIRVWNAPCYEFAHFTDEELADGITAAHDTVNGWTRDELIAALNHWRSEGKDIKLVWYRGGPTAQAQQVVRQVGIRGE